MSSQAIFDKYEIQHRIAIGGMGEVFYAMQRGVSGFERPVILKSLLPDLAQQQELVNQFLDEARVAATLNHPNVVSIFEVGLWNGTFYIAMEYIRGRNLAQLQRRAAEQQVRLSPLVSARIVRDAALGLHHAHGATDSAGQALNIVHRDISPQNIMLREDGVTKVVDFGIASASNRSTRTATGTLKGKLAYMAPEQIHSQPMTPLVDEFALGVVFWELLVGRRLFKADNDLELIKQLLGAEVPRPDALAPDVPAELADVVMRMISRDPTGRYASLGDVADELEGLLVTTPTNSPAAFMRRLGTDDIKLQVPRKTGDNYVISLSPQPGPAPVEVQVDLTTRTGVVAPPSPAAPPARRRALLAAGALVLASTTAWLALGPRRDAPALPSIAVVAPAPTVAPAPVVDAAVAPVVDPPTPVEARLELVTAPPGAQLRLDGRQLGPSPQEVGVTPDTKHYLQAEQPGFERAELEVTAGPGEARKLLITLKPRKQALRVTPAPAVEAGSLTLNTVPWTKVSIDGEPVGSTPISKKRLSPGTHQLVLVNEGANINVTRAVVISPATNTKLQLKLP